MKKIDYFKGNRYATRGILGTIDATILGKMWHCLDQFIDAKQIEPDYLQVFQLSTEVNLKGYQLIITHKQEVPNYINETALVCPVSKQVNEKVYVISDCDEEGNEYSTMLLASEY